MAAGQRAIRWDDGWWSDPERMPAPTDEPVVFHGGLGNAARLRALDRWSPGALCNTTALACSAYYPRVGRWLAAKRHLFSTVRELVASPERVTAPLRECDRIFVRPDSPLKPFSGRVVALDGLCADALDHGFYYDDLDLPIVVAAVEELGREWRLVVTPQGIAAGSGYEAEGRGAGESVVPAAVRDLGEEISRALEFPDPVVVIDVVETEAGLRLLELNPFSGADLYGCDLEAVVQAVTTAVG